ncbi:hypothetical protein SAMN05443428_10977 [Caloramator quimbayensis]|uniref:Uncharacterized protein n=1 Tax=Caloramator quimbayensis TaxID=1147123 RepID=A0A1T4XHU8_9CLOT|nr:hypothetical protein [Caloramator quimbayensis]SKA89119.1 hypothetical protein SAMN05443428_10977 [Caloramator quimbayensis]
MEKEVMEFLMEFKKEVSEQFKQVNEQFKQVNEQFKQVNARLDEHTQILRALEHSAQVNKAEHDVMFNDIAYIKGQIESIKRDLNRVEEATANNWVDIARLKAVK